MYSRLLKPPEKSFFLLGPRGTGKTTWVKNTFPESLYFDLLEAELFNDLLANPQRLENFIPKQFSDWVIIDEIQRIPELLNEVHRLIEKHKYRFILTGSSARKLRRGGHNLLAGRALTCYMHPLSASELGEDFNLAHSLKFGQLPNAYTDKNPRAFLESYVRTYLEQEVREEGFTRSLSAFARFLEAASFSQGNVLNVSSVARECSIERKVVQNYFEILEDMLIAYKLPVFTHRAKRRMSSHPKFFFFDTGVYRTLRPTGALDRPEEAEGAALETLFLQELIAVNDALGLNYKIFFWRPSNNLEVDFILYGKTGFTAFEVKRTGRVSRQMLTGLKSFLKGYPMARAYFVYGGQRYLIEDGIEIVPVADALTNLRYSLPHGKLGRNPEK